MGIKQKIENWDEVIANLYEKVSKTKFVEEDLTAEVLPQHFLSSDNYLLDLILSGGRGWPFGIIAEIFGEEHTGKTTEWMLLGKQVQRAGGSVVLFSAGEYFSTSLAQMHGLKMGKPYLHIFRPKNMEVAFALIEQLAKDAVKLNRYVLIVVDSLAGLVTKAHSRETGSMDKIAKKVGDKGQITSWFFERGIADDIAGSKVLLMFINQVRGNVPQGYGARFAPTTITPGGKALRFAAAIRLECFEREDKRNASGKTIGAIKRIYTAKNKVIGKGKEIAVPIFYNHGWSDAKSLLYYCRVNGILKHKAKGEYVIDKVKFRGKLAGGKGSWLHRMENDKAFFNGMKAIVKKHFIDSWQEDDEWIK